MKTLSYFISDIHLGAGYIADPRGHERRIVNWLEHIKPTAARLFMLGDVLDYWYEYRKVAPRGFVRFLGALASLADSGTEIVWLTGNHDIWLFDYLSNEIGINVVDGSYTTTIAGKKFFMEHGDGVGEIKRGYRLMRATFRNRFAQFLYSAIHPRWTIAFAQGWSKKSRQSENHGPQQQSIQTDIARLTNFADHEIANNNGADFYVFGHLHHPYTAMLNNGTSHLIVLGDCFKQFVAGCFDGQNFKLFTIEADGKMTDLR